MGVIKNLWVRIGADASAAVKGFKEASGAGANAKESIKRSSAETKRSIREMFTSAVPSIKEYTATVTRTRQVHQTAVQNIDRLSDRIAQLESVYGTIKNATDGLNLSKSLGDQIAETEKQLDAINAKIHKTQTAIERIGVPRSAGKQERLEVLQEDLRGLVAESDEAAAHLRALDQAAGRVGTENMGYASAKGLEQLQQEIVGTENELRTTQTIANETKNKLQSMGVSVSTWSLIKKEAMDVGAAFSGIGRSFRDVIQKDPSAGIADRLVRLGRSMKQIPANVLRGVANGFNRIAAAVRSIPEIPEKILTGLKNVGKSAAYAAGYGVGKLWRGIKGLGGTAGRGIASLAGKLLGVGKRASESCGGLSKMVRSIRNIGVASLGMRAFSMVFGELRSVITDYISRNEEVNNSIATMKTQLGEALAPAINLVLQAMERLMPVVTAVSNAINAVFTTLFGKVSATGKAITASAEAAGAAADSLDVYGFDQITKESDNTSGGSGGTAAAQQATEQSALVQKLTSWIAQLKAAFVAGDWAGLGSIVANGINSAVESINAVDIGAKVGNFINNLFTTLHSAITGIDFGNIGAKAGQMLTAAFQKIDWSTVGSTIGSALVALPSILVGFILDTDWATVAQSLSTCIKSAFDRVTQWIKSVDWMQIGPCIANFISNVDWAGLATSLFSNLGAALGATVATLWSCIETAVQAIGDYFGEKIEAAGGNVAQGLLNGIVEGLADIYNWVKDNIFMPFIDSFCQIFGINSPARKVSEKSRFISEGILSGVMSVDVFGKLRSWLTQNVLTPMSDAFSSVKNLGVKAFQSLWGGARSWINKLIGGVESMVNGIIRGINGMIRAFNRIASVGEYFGISLTLSTLSTVSLPKLAKGAVVDEPTPAIIGDAGKEAVMPLERNTGWISDLAKQINQQGGGKAQPVSFAFYFRNRRLAEFLIQDINQITRETGVCPIHI